MMMLCLEWWAFEFMAIFAGLLGTTELAAQSVRDEALLPPFLFRKWPEKGRRSDLVLF